MSDAHRSVASSRKDCYQSNRASVGSSRRHVSRSDITTICPACLIWLCDCHLRTVIGYRTSRYPHLQDLPPQSIWNYIKPAVTRHPLPLFPMSWLAISMNGDSFGDSYRKGYFNVIVSSLCPWLLSTHGPYFMSTLYLVL